MKEFDLDEGLKPFERPKMTDFCWKCRLEVPRTVRICPRCRFDIEGFRMLGTITPGTAAPTVADRSRTPAAVLVSIVLLLVAFAFWWTRVGARPGTVRTVTAPTPVASVPIGVAATEAPRPPSTENEQADLRRAEEEREDRLEEARRNVTLLTSAAPGTPILRQEPAVAETAPIPAFYRVVLTDGTVYDAVAPPEDGSMLTLRLTNGQNVVVYRSDVDESRTLAANPVQPSRP